MSDTEWIQSLTTEAETYRKQGLLKQAKEKYLELLDFVKKHPPFCNNRPLIDAIINKVDVVEREIIEVDQLDESPDLSEEAQNLIKRVFSFSDNQDISAIEGAVALAKFGQYERAMDVFDKLINDGVHVNSDASIEQFTKQYNVLIRDLRDSYRDIREHNVQLLRYAKDLAQSYKKIKEEESLRHKMSRYVGQNLLNKLIQSKDDTLFANERKEVTVFFADIRSFTSICESMSAEDVVSMLNEYFTTMVDVIFRNNGILDKFIGDELMAIFGLITGENTPY